jgi:hypothetical protein
MRLLLEQLAALRISAWTMTTSTTISIKTSDHTLSAFCTDIAYAWTNWWRWVIFLKNCEIGIMFSVFNGFLTSYFLRTKKQRSIKNALEMNPSVVKIGCNDCASSLESATLKFLCWTDFKKSADVRFLFHLLILSLLMTFHIFYV